MGNEECKITGRGKMITDKERHQQGKRAAERAHKNLTMFLNAYDPDDDSNEEGIHCFIQVTLSRMLSHVYGTVQEYLEGCERMGMTQEQLESNQHVIIKLMLTSFQDVIDSIDRNLSHLQEACNDDH